MNRVRELRLAKEKLAPGAFTLAALAARVGVTTGTVWRWEAGQRTPSKRHAKALARALGVTVDQLGLDQVETPTAQPAADPRPRTVSAIIVHPDASKRCVLMTARRKSVKRALAWPGGLVEPGEEPIDAVRRELQEELVLQGCRVERLLGTSETHQDMSPFWGRRFHQGFQAHNFLVTVTSAEVGIVDHEELSGAEWLSIDQVRAAVAELPPDVVDAAVRFAAAATSVATQPAAGV